VEEDLSWVTIGNFLCKVPPPFAATATGRAYTLQGSLNKTLQ